MRFGIAAALLAVVGLALPAVASADPAGEGTFYKEGLRSVALVRNITPGPDGNVWFTDSIASNIPAIGRITPAGTITEYIGGTNLTGLNAESKPRSIVAGPGGSKYLWFTDHSGTTPAIGVIDSASPTTATEFSIQAKGGNAGSVPVDIVAGPEGNLWFTDESEATPAIGVAVLSAENEIEKIEEFSVQEKGGNAGSKPLGIVAGSDGNLWFTDQGSTKAVGKINPSSHAVQEFETGVNSEPGGQFQEFGPHGIVAGPDGNVWFTESGTNEANGQGVCRILTSGEIGKFSCFNAGLIASSNPTGLTVAPGEELWFTDSSGVSEAQALEITATGGTYKVSFEGKETGGTGTGNLLHGATGKGDVKRWPASGSATCTRTAGSNKLTCSTSTTGAEVGMLIEGSGFTAATETTITKIEGSTIEISTTPSTSGSSTNVKAGRIINVETTSGEFEVGQPITGTGIPSSTFIHSVGGGTITPNKAPTAAGTGVSLTAGSETATKTVVTSVTTSTGAFSIGEEISGGGIPAGCKITAVNAVLKTLTLSCTPTEAKTAGSLSSAFSFNATAATLTGALEKLSTIGANGVIVSESGSKRTITFSGGARQNADVEQVSCNESGLTGGSCTVTTTTQGVPNAVGCMTTSGKTCGRYPFAQLFGGPGGITYMPGGNVWLASGNPGTSSSTLGKVGVECVENCPPTNLRTLTVKKSPAGNAGTGLGSVSSKPKGIKCGTACSEAVARMYENSTVELKAKAATGSTIASWSGCATSTGVGGAEGTCTVSMTADKEVKVAFTGSSKAFSPAEALTVTKGESEKTRGKGTIKAAGLGCEAECSSTTVLYQGPITEPKAKPGKVVILKQAPAFGSKFVGWSGCDSETEAGECVVAMETARTVKAEYEALPNKVLTVNKSYSSGNGSVASKPKGIKCGTTCTQAVAQMPEGAAVELVAKPGLETAFVKWEGGDCNGSTNPVCVVTMNVNETTKAVFSKAGKAFVSGSEPALTLNKAGSGSGTVKAAGLGCEVLCSSTTVLYQGPITEPKAKPGKVVVLKAVSAPGSTAVSWSGCGSIDEEGNCVVAMESAKTVTATFDELE